MPGVGRLASIVALCAAASSPCFAMSEAQTPAKSDPDEALSRAFSQLTSTTDVGQDRPDVKPGPTVVYDLSAPRSADARQGGYEQIRADPSNPSFNPFMAPLREKPGAAPGQ